MKRNLAGLALIIAFAVPAASFAQSFDVQSQIQALLAQIQQLQAKIAQLTQGQATTPPVSSRPFWCDTYSYLSVGARGNDVAALQGAIGTSELGSNPTGYYGVKTQAAWAHNCGPIIVGGDRDIHGCIGSAGYSWCAAKNKCLRTWEESCVAPVVDPSTDPQCKAWYDGCNTCSRSYPGGPGMCTMMACLATDQSIWKAPAYCKEYFNGSTNRPPTVSSFSGPTALSVNQQGTWSIQASDPENGQLTYDIRWGDEYAYPTAASAAMDRAFAQTTTFTHSYATAGTYTVSVTVRDNTGQTANTTTTVQVQGGGVACTMEYAPVCGRPTGCANTCALGYACPAYCQLPSPVTYSNTCMMNAAGASYLYGGVCDGRTAY